LLKQSSSRGRNAVLAVAPRAQASLSPLLKQGPANPRHRRHGDASDLVSIE